MDALWYASYGSNLAADRLMCYLSGGCPDGATRRYVGARDPSPPRDVRPMRLPGTVHFAWRSPTWGGGIAFLDVSTDRAAYGRGYLLTLGQFSDLAAQEMHRDPGEDLDLAELLRTGRWAPGPGRYESLHVLDRIDGVPVVTFTAPWRAEQVRAVAPTDCYLRTMAHGLSEAHGLTRAQVVDYLLGLRGVDVGWDEQRLMALLQSGPPEGSQRRAERLRAGRVDG